MCIRDRVFTDRGLYVSSVVITRYVDTPAIQQFKHKLEKLGLKVYRHYEIDGYPSNIPLIVSDEGYGKNDYVETTRPLVVVTAPGLSLIHIWRDMRSPHFRSSARARCQNARKIR